LSIESVDEGFLLPGARQRTDSGASADSGAGSTRTRWCIGRSAAPSTTSSPSASCFRRRRMGRRRRVARPCGHSRTGGSELFWPWTCVCGRFMTRERRTHARQRAPNRESWPRRTV